MHHVKGRKGGGGEGWGRELIGDTIRTPTQHVARPSICVSHHTHGDYVVRMYAAWVCTYVEALMIDLIYLASDKRTYVTVLAVGSDLYLPLLVPRMLDRDRRCFVDSTESDQKIPGKTKAPDENWTFL